MTPMQEDLDRVLFDEPTILRRLDELARDITTEYEGRELTVIAVLNGSFIFMADLLRRIPLPLKLDCLSVASYHGKHRDQRRSSLQANRAARRGRAAHPHSRRHSRQRRHARGDPRQVENEAGRLSVKICVLLRKLKPRLHPVEADHVGFNIGDEFVVGYGLDYMERYRNLPCIGVLRKDKLAPPHQA